MDEIGDDGKQKKASKKAAAGADGGKEFVHMGSSAVDRSKKEEEKSNAGEMKMNFKRPMFTGKAKIGGGATSSTEQTGPNVQYDFGVKYKTQNTDDSKKGDRKPEGEDNAAGANDVVKKDKRHTKQGRNFNREAVALDDQDLDDGFEMVTNKTQTRRNNQRAQRNRDEDDFSRRKEDVGGPVLKKGGAFGNLEKDSD